MKNIEAERLTKGAFSVIGIEGSTDDGKDFVAKLWNEANSRFAEVAPLAKRNGAGALIGVWGAMSDVGRRFLPWEDGFSRGLYLAGVEAIDGAAPPPGWTRWTMPAREYVRIMSNGDAGGCFANGLIYLAENALTLTGAACDFTDPATGVSYVYFPIGMP